MNALPRRHAAVIGIDAYGQGISPLRSAVADARAVARALAADHGYEVPGVLLDAEATGARILRLLEETLPRRIRPDSGLVLYFAGHGITRGDGSAGPEGFLMPQDAHPADETTWLPMDRVKKALERLPCRHLLVVLDCCFAGCFRWASTRNFVAVGRPLFDSQYNHYLLGTAWQVLTSASHDEKAQDVVPGAHDSRDDDGAEGHSPFAAALLRGLAGEADFAHPGHEPDGVMTATELYQYVFEKLVPPGSPSRQTPGLWPLKPENTGEFIFLSPRQKKKTRPDPPLDDTNNPWLGLRTYEEEDAPLFFGRQRVAEQIVDRLQDEKSWPLLAVVGASGTGKSSVVKAGVVPLLRQASPAWTLVSVRRLGKDPRIQLAEAEDLLAAAPGAQHRLLLIDQFEELYTRRPDAAARDGFLERLRELIRGDPPVRVLLTLRSDFEPRLRDSRLGRGLLHESRYMMPPLTSEELREIVERPATAKALYFEPAELAGELVDEVMAMPGALPLLSFALTEMYRQARRRRRETGALDRALTRQDYQDAGGVVGALHRRASELLKESEAMGSLDTVRRIALRLVSVAGGRVSRRRVSQRELEYTDPKEQEVVNRVIGRLTEARLIVADDGYVEVAHDTLVQAWPQLTTWLEEADLRLLRNVSQAAVVWDEGKRAAGSLWDQDPRLPHVRTMRDELNRLEGEFVEASVRRKKRRLTVFAAALATVLMLLAGAALYSNSKRLEAGAALERTQRVAAFLEESLNRLGELLWAKGDFEAVESLFREYLELSEERVDVAENLSNQALKMYRRLLADEHPGVARSLNNLAFAFYDKWDYEEAEPLLRETLERNRRLLGDEHPDVARSLNNLGHLFYNVGDYKEAETLYREALEMRRRLLGDEHPDVAGSLNNLALSLHHMGDSEAAEALCREALEMRRRLLGDEHPRVAISLNNHAQLLIALDRAAEAEETIREALEIFRKSLPPDHWRIPNAESVLGAVLAALGRYEEAEPLLVASYPVVRDVKGDSSRYTRDVLERLVALYDAWGKPEKASEYRALWVEAGGS